MVLIFQLLKAVGEVRQAVTVTPEVPPPPDMSALNLHGNNFHYGSASITKRTRKLFLCLWRLLGKCISVDFYTFMRGF